MPRVPLNRNFRLGVWVLAVAGALIFQQYSIAATISCLLLIFGLLCTTPPNAIRLPRWGSELFILVTTAVERHAPHRLAPNTLHLCVLLMTLLLLRLWRKSPWWAVLYAWFPI